MLRVSTLFTIAFLSATLPAQATEFVASLDGAQEVPANPSLVKGKLQLQLDTTTSTISYKVVCGTFPTTVSAAHIHKGAIGVSGAVVFAISGGPAIFAGISRTLSAAEITDLRAGLWYVNVHTTAYPGGEIRGQVLAAALPTTFGTGCQGSNSKTPTISARSFACANNSVFRINLTNAKESSTAFLLIGNSKTSWLSIPLPFDLGAIGMTGCTAYCNDTGLGGSGSFTDATGAAFIPILVPYDHSIVGVTLYSQWVVADPVATLLGFTTSNALDWKIQ